MIVETLIRVRNISAWDQASHGGKREKNSASEASREVAWGEERVAEPGDKPLL